MDSIAGFIYCPPDWDQERLTTGKSLERIKKISTETFTDISFIPALNKIEVLGDAHEEVLQAQKLLNELFEAPQLKAKKSWIRPDRPGNWGERRDKRKSFHTSRNSISSSSSGEARLK
jgi:hypothetical protein